MVSIDFKRKKCGKEFNNYNTGKVIGKIEDKLQSEKKIICDNCGILSPTDIELTKIEPSHQNVNFKYFEMIDQLTRELKNFPTIRKTPSTRKTISYLHSLYILGGMSLPIYICRKLILKSIECDRLLKERLKMFKLLHKNTSITNKNYIKLLPSYRNAVKDSAFKWMELNLLRKHYELENLKLNRILCHKPFFNKIEKKEIEPRELLLTVYGGKEYIDFYLKDIENTTFYYMYKKEELASLKKLIEKGIEGKNDILQEVLIAVLKSIKKFNPGKMTLAKWLYHSIIYNCLSNLAKSYYRQKRKIISYTKVSFNTITNTIVDTKEVNDEDLPEEIPKSAIIQPFNTEEIIINEDLMKIIQNSKLNPKQQQILFLIAEGKELKEIPVLLKISRSTLLRNWKIIKFNEKYIRDIIYNPIPPINYKAKLPNVAKKS